MGARRAFGTLELLFILVILAVLIWLLFSARAGNSGASLSPGMEDAIRDLILTTRDIAAEVPR